MLPEHRTPQLFSASTCLYILGWATAHVMVQASHGCPLVRIPYKLLRDFSVDGALWVVLHTCLHYKTAQGWRRMEWQNSGKQEGCMEMLRLALQELQVIWKVTSVPVELRSSGSALCVCAAEGVLHAPQSVLQAHSPRLSTSGHEGEASHLRPCSTSRLPCQTGHAFLVCVQKFLSAQGHGDIAGSESESRTRPLPEWL